MREVQEHVRAELVGTIISVDCQVGQTVRAGDQVVLLESMKMEIPILSEVAGTVTKISARVGATVKAGQSLVELCPTTTRHGGAASDGSG